MSVPPRLSEPHLDLTALRNAVASLEGASGLVSNNAWFSEQTPVLQNTLIAGVIQNFEFVYELSVKMLRRQIELDSDSPGEIDQTNFRDLLRIAAEKGLIDDVQAWFFYRRMRNLSSHTYDQEKARQVCLGTLQFIGDARSLLANLEVRNA